MSFSLSLILQQQQQQQSSSADHGIVGGGVRVSSVGAPSAGSGVPTTTLTSASLMSSAVADQLRNVGAVHQAAVVQQQQQQQRIPPRQLSYHQYP